MSETPTLLEGLFPKHEPLAGVTIDEVGPEIAAALGLQEKVTQETSELLEACQRWILRYVVLSGAQSIILAAWVLHTYVFEAGEIATYIHITAPERECGKSILMLSLAEVSAEPICCDGISAAALVRAISLKRPSIFLDEMDSQMGGDREFAETVRGILNAGYRKSGRYLKCDGKSHELREFNVYSPKCFAGIGKLPETVASRSIAIEMRRKTEEETVEPFRTRQAKENSEPIRARLKAWKARGAERHIENIRPAALHGLGARQNDVAEPLLCVATLAGPVWLQRLSNALMEVLGKSRGEDISLGVSLLTDIRNIFDELNTDRIWSEDLAEHLGRVEGSPWSEWKGKAGFTKNALALQLRRYRIHPKKMRIAGAEGNKQGYERDFFEDVWEWYCSPQSSRVSNGTLEQPASLLAETAFSERNANGPQMEQEQGDGVPFTPSVPPRSISVPFQESAPNPHEQWLVPDIPVQKGERGNGEIRI